MLMDSVMGWRGVALVTLSECGWWIFWLFGYLGTWRGAVRKNIEGTPLWHMTQVASQTSNIAHDIWHHKCEKSKISLMTYDNRTSNIQHTYTMATCIPVITCYQQLYSIATSVSFLKHLGVLVHSYTRCIMLLVHWLKQCFIIGVKWFFRDRLQNWKHFSDSENLLLLTTIATSNDCH